MNKIFGLAISVVVVVALLVVFKEQVTTITTSLFTSFQTAITGGLGG